MKKIIFILALILIFFNTADLRAMETLYEESPSQTTEITYQDENISITENLNVLYDKTKSSDTNYVNVTKESIIKNSNGAKIAIFKLSATFSYDGSSSSCTNVSHQTTVVNSNWEFLIAYSFKTGNTAYGTYTLKNSITENTVSDSLTIKCDKNGNIT